MVRGAQAWLAECHEVSMAATTAVAMLLYPADVITSCRNHHLRGKHPLWLLLVGHFLAASKPDHCAVLGAEAEFDVAARGDSTSRPEKGLTCQDQL